MQFNKFHQSILVTMFYAVPLIVVCLIGIIAPLAGCTWLDAQCERLVKGLRQESGFYD